ncbi:MAG: alpha-galactosidase [Oscillospiraceae bacterium]|nr:alpha-galactosidase [Oscillospiraceae bacterium]
MIIKTGNMFFLQGRGTSYVIRISEEGYVLHDYFGAEIAPEPYAEDKRGWWCMQATGADGACLDEIRQEYPCYGHTDLRRPAVNANRGTVLKYKDYEIIDGKPDLKRLPSALGGGSESLIITLADELSGAEVKLNYTVFEGSGIVCRSAVITNTGDEPLVIDRAFSASIEFPCSDFVEMHFSGSWGRERHVVKNELVHGIYEIENARGGSGNQINPFVILKDKAADEDGGDCYGFMLVYSGDHCTEIEVDQRGRTRVNAGINPFMFEKTLVKGESFTTPECILGYGNGLGELSREYHDFIRKRICRGSWSRKERPVLINNWEATYMDFDEDKLISIATLAAELGIELFVLDDGWFGKRDNDRCSLGDWTVNTDKIPSGLSGLAKKINGLGLKFGLWFEPEMVSPDSELYRAHPDWVIRSGREPALIRSQLVLDLTKPEVREYIINAVNAVLNSANIEYVKWDMNRYITDMPRKGFNYEYTLGFYEIMDGIVNSHPDILFEGCSSGGARFDAGVLCYMPQIWTSDDTDPIERVYIQYGTSFGYPPSTMGSHVTESPNQHTRRHLSMKTRGDVSLSGNFGYELDITKLNEADLEAIKEQTALCRELRGLVEYGDFYRLFDPFDGNLGGWMSVSGDKSRAYVCIARVLFKPNSYYTRLKLKGLDKNSRYRDLDTGKEYMGDMLMNRGLLIEFPFGDFTTVTMRLERIEGSTSGE